jgi:hypothetical protein
MATRPTRELEPARNVLDATMILRCETIRNFCDVSIRNIYNLMPKIAILDSSLKYSWL